MSEFRDVPRDVHPEDWTPIEVEGLEPGAWEALRHEGAAAVAAGPGAGKTEFLAQRAAYLLQTGICASPRRILAISFKRESAANLKRRVSKRVPEHSERFVSMTFDAFAKGLVDRFLRLLPVEWRIPPGGYKLEYLNSRQVGDILQVLSDGEDTPGRLALNAVESGTFLPRVVGTWPLPTDRRTQPDAGDQAAYAAWRWWEDQYIGQNPASVEFTMINRLADLIVRENPALRRALRATYPYVFVDEFQDTTDAQITLLGNVFAPPDVIITAVGDRKQRIMRFAGALEDAMTRFAAEFDAKRFELTWNFRSSPELVEVQHQIASVLEPSVAKAISRAKAETGHTAVSVWNYSSEIAQARHLAAWISSEINDNARGIEDFALIARQKVVDLAPTLQAAFAAHGLKLRNDEEKYGRLSLQELLKHDITHLFLGVLQLSQKDRQLPTVWTETLALLRRIREPYDVNADRVAADELASFSSDVGGWLASHEPGSAEADELIAMLLQLVEQDELTGFVHGQNVGDEVEAVIKAITARLEQSSTDAATWDEVLRRFLAHDAIPIMTYHRSKGLEYHTVIALALDANQWWAYKNDKAEGNSTFFVGLSRAAHRVIFTSYAKNARQRLPDLYALLDAAGAEHTYWG